MTAPAREAEEENVAVVEMGEIIPAPAILRPCAVRSIASGFFAHVSLVVDGLICKPQ